MTSAETKPRTSLALASGGATIVGIGGGLVYTLIAPEFWGGDAVAEGGALIPVFGVVFQLFELAVVYLVMSLCLTLLVHAQLALAPRVFGARHRRWRESGAYYVANGLVCSLIGFVVLVIAQAIAHVMPESWRYWHQLLTLAAVGQAAALVFWRTR